MGLADCCLAKAKKILLLWISVHCCNVAWSAVITTTNQSDNDGDPIDKGWGSELPNLTSTTELTNIDQNVESVLEKFPNSTDTNSTSMNYIIEYKPQVFDSPEDIKTQREWGGNCTLAHWDNCKVLASWFGKYEDPKDGEIKEYTIDCKEEPVVCLKNSWTVTRCNLLCMSRCNVSGSTRFTTVVNMKNKIVDNFVIKRLHVIISFPERNPIQIR